jgi:hypothetical protein
MVRVGDLSANGADAERMHALAFGVATLARERGEMGRLADDREREPVPTVERLREVERAMAGIAAREGDLRERFIDTQDQLIQRDQLLAEAREHAEALELEVRELRIRLERIYALKPFALYRSIRGLPVLRALEARRVSRVDDAIRRSIG